MRDGPADVERPSSSSALTGFPWRSWIYEDPGPTRGDCVTTLLLAQAWLHRPELEEDRSVRRRDRGEGSGGRRKPSDHDVVTGDAAARLQRVRDARAELQVAGPNRTRPLEGDFERVSLPATDCDILRDALVADGARVVIEVGLAYGSSALAIGEALCSASGTDVSHIVIDPFQSSAYDNVGWEALTAAGLAPQTTLIEEASSIALARLAADRFNADAAFVDGSHRFHEVFVDLYFLRKLVRPGGLIMLDDAAWPSVATALRYFDLNLGWRPVSIAGRLTARRLPDDPSEPAFHEFKPF